MARLLATCSNHSGGDTLNTAIYLARASQPTDIQVSYLTAMGQDPLSQQIIVRWQQAGIDTSAVLIDQQRHPGLYLIQLDDHGERTFLYWRNDSAARYLMQHPQLPRLKQTVSDVDALYLSGISLAILPAADRQALLQWLAELHRAGVAIIFDSNYRPALWQSPADARACYQQLLAITTLALVTDDDEQALWGGRGCDPNPAAPHCGRGAAGGGQTGGRLAAVTRPCKPGNLPSLSLPKRSARWWIPPRPVTPSMPVFWLATCKDGRSTSAPAWATDWRGSSFSTRGQLFRKVPAAVSPTASSNRHHTKRGQPNVIHY